jgi:hypothetical protein
MCSTGKNFIDNDNLEGFFKNINRFFLTEVREDGFDSNGSTNWLGKFVVTNSNSATRYEYYSDIHGEFTYVKDDSWEWKHSNGHLRYCDKHACQEMGTVKDIVDRFHVEKFFQD